jgi:hypothetical protein
MAASALFVGFGDPVRGRERQAIKVFNEAVGYYSGLQQNGEIEAFEPVFLEAHGGDLMVDDLKSSKPDDRHFVVPRRGQGEKVRVYIVRIEEATARLQRHPPRPD